MLPKANRLNLKLEFKRVIGGQRIENDLIKIAYVWGDNDLPRVGISVSSKIFKRAVDRNRAKRMVARGFKVLLPKLSPGLKIVVLPKGAVLSTGAEDLAGSLEKTLQGKGLLK